MGSFRLARAAGACCICQRIVGRSIQSCGRKTRPRGGSVSDTIEKVAGNASKSKKIDQAGRDMGPSPATVCLIMWVNQAQA